MEDEEKEEGGRGERFLEAGSGGRAAALWLSPWVFLSWLQGSRHNSLNWLSLLHIQDKESQRDFFVGPLLWAKGSEDFPLLSQLLSELLCSHTFPLKQRLP